MLKRTALHIWDDLKSVTIPSLRKEFEVCSLSSGRDAGRPKGRKPLHLVGI
jgi:hypothetical protein